MTYRLDDEGAHLDAVVSAGNEVYGACIRAGQESCRQMKGGEFSRAMALLIAPARIWTKAIERGLVAAVGNGAYQLCTALFLDWNPTSEQAKAMRGKRAASGRLGGKQKASNVLGKTFSKTEAEVCPMGLASGSDLSLEGELEGGRPSEVKLKSVPPPANDHPIQSPEHVAIALQIRAHDCFRGVDAHHVADHHVGRMQGTGQKLEWAITAINECAEKKGGLGLNAEAMQGSLVGFLKAGRGERREQASGEVKSGSAYVEDDDEETVERIRRMPKRVTAQDAAAKKAGEG